MENVNRYKTKKNGKRYHLCKGKKNDICMKNPNTGGLCKGCIAGVDRTVFRGHIAGDLFTVDDVRYRLVIPYS